MVLLKQICLFVLILGLSISAAGCGNDKSSGTFFNPKSQYDQFVESNTQALPSTGSTPKKVGNVVYMGQDDDNIKVPNEVSFKFEDLKKR